MERKRKFMRRPGDKTNRHSVRFTDDESDKLTYLETLFNKSRSEIIRDCVDLMYEKYKKID